MTFEFATAGRILFGRGTVAAVPALAREPREPCACSCWVGADRGSEALTGWTRARPASARWSSTSSGEPTTHLVDQATDLARDEALRPGDRLGRGQRDRRRQGRGGHARRTRATSSTTWRSWAEASRSRGPACRSSPCPPPPAPGTEVTRNAVLDVPEHR